MTEVVKIKSGDSPSGEFPAHGQKKAQIRGQLHDTDPGHIDRTGQTYRDAASKIEQAVNALEDHARKIREVWKGPDATKARAALSKLTDSGKELSSALMDMGGALSAYAAHLTDARAKVDEKVNAPTSGEGAAVDDVVRKELEDSHARRTLYELNQKIVSIYATRIPDEVALDFPKVKDPGAPAETRNPGYPTGSGQRGLASGAPVSDPGGGSYTGGSGSGSGSGTGSGYGTGSGSGTGSVSGTGTANPGGSAPEGSDPGGSKPGGSDPGDTPAPDSSADPNPAPPATPDPGQAQPPGSETGDDPVPPVIGGEDTTTTDGPNVTDPRQTDFATHTPTPVTLTTVTPTAFNPTAFNPATFNPTAVTPVNPPGILTPVGSSPGTPAVIGSPGAGGAGHLTLPAGGRGPGAVPGGMPLAPFLEGGGGAAGEQGDLQRNTYVPEDKSSWTMDHDTTNPVIG